ncbi:hypothetical protein EDD36DRAFT_161039 [Exophiala viscosa]|uniref:Uncharacterized protein n=1 Tax=Exophiala viscosa TaxID=2486360 RepID=A0AAN6E3X1_9EURO|nr:hypothetical protein EDD36DRAFT_161039 [Exophiala viscosa]
MRNATWDMDNWWRGGGGGNDDEEEPSQDDSENESGVDEDDGSQSETSTTPEPESCIGDPPSETREARRMKSKIRYLLDTLTTSGKFAHKFVIENPVNPGLRIAEHGIVGLPITADVAASLLGHRNTMESDPGYALSEACNIKLINLQWCVAVESARKRLCDELFAGEDHSLAGPRLVLCSTAQDLTEILGATARLNVLGTVLITLPAITGDFQVYLSNATEKFSFESSDNSFSSAEIAWLRDTKVQLSGLKQGCFAALAYDILSSHGPEAQPSTFAEAIRCRTQLRELLDAWFTAGTGIVGTANSLAYRLSRTYPESLLNLGTLDAIDSAIASFLEKTCEDTPYSICLANVSRTILEDTYHQSESQRAVCPSSGANAIIEFFADDKTVLDEVYDLRGKPIAGGAEFDTTWLIQNDVYDGDRAPDEEHFEGEDDDVRCFEEDNPHKHVYLDTVVLILTRHALVDLIVGRSTKSEADRARCIRDAYEQTKKEPSNQETRLFLQTLCRRILERVAHEKQNARNNGSRLFTGAIYPFPSSKSQRPEDDLLSLVIDVILERPEPETSDILQKAIELTDMSAQAGVEKIIRIMPVLQFEPFSQSLSIAAGQISQLKDRYERLKTIESWCLQFLPARYQDLRDWTARHLANFCRSLSEKDHYIDGDVLTEIALSYQSDSFMSCILAPGIGINCCQALLHGFQGTHGDAYAVSQIPVVVRAIVRDFASDELARKAPIAALLEDSIELEGDLFNDLINALIASPAMRGRKGIPSAFDAQRSGLSRTLKTQPDSSQREKIEKLFSDMMVNYHVFEVGRRPQKYPNFQRCMCPALQTSPKGQEVNAFLLSPNVSTFTSVKWDARTRDDISRALIDCDKKLTVYVDKVRGQGISMYQLYLRKEDHIFEDRQRTWRAKRNRYRDMLSQIADLGFLQDSRYAYLRSEDWKYMETLVLPQGPLSLRRYFTWSLSAIFREELTRKIEQQGGRVLDIPDIDGPDVIGIGDGRPLDFAGSTLRYWQPPMVHANEMLHQLQQMASASANANVNAASGEYQALTDLNARKRKADHLEPLAESSNLAGQQKRPMRGKEVEIIDLVDD